MIPGPASFLLHCTAPAASVRVTLHCCASQMGCCSCILLPNDTMSPPDAEIKGDVSNRNAVSDGKAGARGAQGVKEARPCRACEGLTHAACSQGRGCTSGRRSSFSRKNTLQNPSEKNPKCVSLGSLDTLMMMKHKNSILPRQRSQLSHEDKGSPPCALLLQGGESSSSSCI